MDKRDVRADFLAAASGYFATIATEADIRDVQSAYRSFEIPRPLQFGPV